jgi:hypothetical protein
MLYWVSLQLKFEMSSRPLPAPDLGPMTIEEKQSKLKPMKPIQTSRTGFPSAVAKREMVYTTRPKQPNDQLISLNDAGAFSASSVSQPRRVMPRDDEATASRPQPSAQMADPSRSLLNGNDNVSPDEISALERNDKAANECVTLAMRVIRSTSSAQRLIAYSALLRCHARDPQGLLGELTKSVESGQRLFFIVRGVGDANMAIHRAACDLLSKILCETTPDEDSRAAFVRLSLYGAAIVEDTDENRQQPANDDTSFSEISEIAFSDPPGAVTELQLHARLASSLQYNDMESASSEWQLLEAIADSPRGSAAVLRDANCAAAVRKALDMLLVEGLLLMDGGTGVAASVAGVLRRCGGANRKTATLVLANYGDVLSLLASTILSEDEVAAAGQTTILRNAAGDRCCMNIFSFFANCARHGLWRDEFTDLLIRGHRVGSLRVLEALVLTPDGTLHNSLKSFLSRDVLRLVQSKSVDASKLKSQADWLELTTGMHLLASWFGSASVSSLTSGEQSPVTLVTALKALVQQLCGPESAEDLFELLITSAWTGPVAADRAALVHGRIRLALSIGRLVPGSMNTVMGFAQAVIDRLANCGSALFTAASAQRRFIGPAVAAILETLRAVRDHTELKNMPVSEGITAPLRTSTLLSGALVALELVRSTQIGLDAVEELILPILMPASIFGDSTSYDALLARSAHEFVVEDSPIPTANDVISRVPWFVKCALLQNSAGDATDHAIVGVRLLWARWLRWLLSHVPLASLSQRESSASNAARLLLAVGASWMTCDMTSVRNEVTQIVVAAGTSLLSSCGRNESSSRVSMGNVSSVVQAFLESFSASEESTSVLIFSIVIFLLASACQPELQLVIAEAWLRNYTVARQSADIGREAASSEFAGVFDGCRLRDYIGRWRSSDVLRLIDAAAASFSFGSAEESAPFAMFVAEVITRSREALSDFEMETVDDAVNDQFASANYDPAAWCAASAEGSVLDLVKGNCGSMID